ncbi:MAG: DUF6600 domain-containing protein [Candidatus Krumholzibacteriia bacterium]
MSKYSESRLSKRLGLLLFACMFVVGLGYAQNASAVVRVSAGVNIHGGGGGGYDLLSDYGEWMRVPAYGVVWCPYVDESWAPFYDGRWIWTRRGWAWDSYEPFGELVYHYGYWYHNFDIGWFWVPGNEWSPARVQWYTYGNYCGWAPLPPPHFYWPDPWDSYGFNIWVVVHINDFCDDHVGHRGIDRPRYRDVFHRDKVVKRAPDFQRVETAARRQIPVRSIAERPMDIRTDRIKIAERSATRRDVRARGAAPANQGVRSQRQTVQSQRQTATPAVTRRSERKVAAQRANSPPRREVVTSRQTARVERKAEAPARSARSAQSRNVEKRSDRDAGTKEKR